MNKIKILFILIFTILILFVLDYLPYFQENQNFIELPSAEEKPELVNVPETQRIVEIPENIENPESSENTEKQKNPVISENPEIIIGFADDDLLGNPEMTDDVKVHFAKFKKYEKKGKFQYKMTRTLSKNEYDMFDVEFPSVLKHGPEENSIVAGVYYAQKLNNKPAPAVVILHHLQNDQTLERLIASFFTTKGISSLVLYLPFYGPRSSDKNYQSRFLSADLEFVEKTFIQSVFDIRRANEFLKARPEIDSTKITLLGISLGGCVAALSSGIDPLFDKYILVLAGGDFAEIIFNDSSETRKIMEEFKKLNITKEKAREMLVSIEPLTYAHLLPKDKVIMFNTLQDEIIPKTCTEQLWEKLNKPEINWYLGNHTGIAFAANDVLIKSVNFILK